MWELYTDIPGVEVHVVSRFIFVLYRMYDSISCPAARLMNNLVYIDPLIDIPYTFTDITSTANTYEEKAETFWECISNLCGDGYHCLATVGNVARGWDVVLQNQNKVPSWEKAQ